MFKKTLLTAACLTSFCFADNFLIGNSQGGISSNSDTHESAEPAQVQQQEKLPQRIVIEDVNPSSELGQLIGVMLKNEQKRLVVASAPKPKPKIVVKKKKPVKKTVKKKVTSKKSVVHSETKIEVKSEEASKVGEHEKKDAEHNENNSSLKKISSSNICD
jgi:hypothetical protein